MKAAIKEVFDELLAMDEDEFHAELKSHENSDLAIALRRSNKKMNKFDKWCQDWPEEEGLFWFYGYRYGRVSCGTENKPEYMLMKVRKIANGFMHTADGQFMGKDEVEEAWFIRALVPNPPKEFKE